MRYNTRVTPGYPVVVLLKVLIFPFLINPMERLNAHRWVMFQGSGIPEIGGLGLSLQHEGLLELLLR